VKVWTHDRQVHRRGSPARRDANRYPCPRCQGTETAPPAARCAHWDATEVGWSAGEGL